MILKSVFESFIETVELNPENNTTENVSTPVETFPALARAHQRVIVIPGKNKYVNYLKLFLYYF